MGGEASRVTNLEDFEAELHTALESSRPYLVEVISSLDASAVYSLR